MAQSKPYTRLSELLAGSREHRQPDTAFRCEHTANLIEEALRTIDAMNNDEREAMMKLLTSWLVVEKFGLHARSVVQGFQKYSIAECLFDDPDWRPPVFASEYDQSTQFR